MKLITETQRKRLLNNGKTSAHARLKNGNVPDFVPVVKLFTPDANATWLLTDSINETVAWRGWRGYLYPR